MFSTSNILARLGLYCIFYVELKQCIHEFTTFHMRLPKTQFLYWVSVDII